MKKNNLSIVYFCCIGVISNRDVVGCPKSLPLSTQPTVVPVSPKEEDEDTNPFLGIISDGEDSAEEEQERYFVLCQYQYKNLPNANGLY